MFLKKSRKLLTVLLVLFMTLSCLWSASATEPEVTPEPVGTEVGDVIPEPPSDPVEETPAPDPTPEVTPEPTPEVTPEVTPEPTPEETPEAPPAATEPTINDHNATGTDASGNAHGLQRAVIHKVTLKTGGEDVILFVKDGEILERPARAPKLEGYVFEHWYLKNTNILTPFVFGKPVVSDLVLIAYFVEEVKEETPEDIETPEGTDENETEEPETTDLDDGTDGLDIIIVEDPADEDNGESTTDIPDGQVPLAGPEATEPVERKVEIRKNFGKSVVEGDMIVLTGVLTGFDGLNVSYQWQVNDGSGWRNIDGATNISYVFAANAQTVEYGFRLGVSVNE